MVCLQVKGSTQKHMGLLQPLPTPKSMWEDIFVDFITRLPIVQGKSVIIVVVDKLTKFSYFDTLSTNHNANTVAEYFVNHIIKLHDTLFQLL